MISINHFNYKLKTIFNATMTGESKRIKMLEKKLENFALGYDLTKEMKKNIRKLIDDVSKTEVIYIDNYFL